MHVLARPEGAGFPRARRVRVPRPRRLARVVAVALVALLASACIPATEQEQDVWAKTIVTRKQLGVPGDLHSNDALTLRAQEWARSLATRRLLAHSDLRTLDTGWSAVAENVGRGASHAAVFDQLMASPAHRANIVDPRWNQMGVGVATGRDGTVYVVQVFQRV